MRNKNKVAGMVVAGCLAGALIAQANLILNGSFEDGNFTNPEKGQYSGNGWTHLYDGSTDITGWTVGGDVDWHDITGSYELQSAHGIGGTRAVDLSQGWGGTGIYSISQTFDTVVGQTYSLSFLLAAPSLSQAPKYFDSTVFVNVALSSETFNQDAQPQKGYVPQLVTTHFTATEGKTTLKFTGRNDGGWWSPVIDDVRVTLPDGGMTMSLLGAAMLGLAGLRRKLGL